MTYIAPTLSLYKTLDDLFNLEPEMMFVRDVKHPTFAELFEEKYLLFVGEPGFGKTRLFKELVLKAHEHQKKAFYLDAKKIIDSDIAKNILTCKEIDPNISEQDLLKQSKFSNTDDASLDENTLICIDALDELPFEKLYTFMEMIETFMQQNSLAKLFVSCRTHHLKKMDFDVASLAFKFIEIDKFYGKQIKDYMESFDAQKASFIFSEIQKNGLFEILQTPRYLYYFCELTKDMKIEEIIKLSRIELFNHFIYRKLDKERDVKTPQSQYDVIKRVLEKIAFIMKIYQVSQISKDELMTIFDSVESNFSQIIFRDDLLNILYDRSVLKDNLDFVEFENQTFLDFLAAKELLRFDKLDQRFFDLAMEPTLQEIFANWFYVTPFLIDQNSTLLELFIAFVQRHKERVLREEYFDILVSINAETIDFQTKSRIFNIVFDYYTRHDKSLWRLADKLANFYCESEHYALILESAKSKTWHMSKQRNAVKLISSVYKKGKLSAQQLKTWKETFSAWLQMDVKENQYLHETIVSHASIFAKNDFEWVKNHRFIFEKGVQLQHEYARTCREIAPEDSFSIDVYFEAEKLFNKNKVDRNRISGFDVFECISECRTSVALEYILSKFLQREQEHYSLKYHYLGLREKQVEILFENIAHVLNDTLRDLLNQFLLKVFYKNFHYSDAYKVFIRLIVNVLIKDNQKYLEELLEELITRLNTDKIYYFEFQEFIILNLFPFITVDNFDIILNIFKKMEHSSFTLEDLMINLFYTETLNSKVKEKIHSLFHKEIQKRNKAQAKYAKMHPPKKQKSLCDQWLYKIEPVLDRFHRDLFSFFISHQEELKQCPAYEINRQRMIALSHQILLHNNPLDGKVKRSGENSYQIWEVPFLYSCINFLYHEKIVLTDQMMVDNAFRYLPFSTNSNDKMIFELASKPSSKALQDVVDVYAGKRRDDLAMRSPENFMQMYQNLRIKEAEPLLLKMIANQKIAKHIREEIVDILPPEVLTKKRIDAMRKKPELEKDLKEAFLKALVMKHDDKEAFAEVIEYVKQTAMTTHVPEGKDSTFMTDLDDHRGQNSLNQLLIHHEEYTKKIDEDLLVLASSLRKEKKHANAEFLEKIVTNHLKQLRHLGSFEPIHKMESFMLRNQNELELGSFEYGFDEAKKSYLEAIAKPSNMADALRKYREFKDKLYLPIASTSHLLEVIKRVIEKDLKQWVEDEGAYKHIELQARKEKKLDAEEFISKTLMPPIKLALYEHGFRATDFRLHREEQLMDDKRIDYTISYGFIGQILLELKLDFNMEADARKKIGKEYVKKLHQYIQGSHSDYGIFLIFNIRSSKEDFEKQLQNLHELYRDELNINVMGLNCKID
ncbi:hypothetical protein SJPD1_2333 [Sulfurospirillum diekertiae]|uniref:NACHT domain-containing protein n=1 Tax=Sulfurospirillum diekertiae TaxID=1854492 RepID=A0A290HYJ1_9BACT|nr:hypothetical protein [Sulfurospirillum diekertiae]ATB70429.1 hypothetical protein SJPD1_2333 [Sulfurospirillum diekertiae]